VRSLNLILNLNLNLLFCPNILWKARKCNEMTGSQLRELSGSFILDVTSSSCALLLPPPGNFT
jgi:hypothetical protein